MEAVEAFPGLNGWDQEVLGLLCGRALALGNLLAPLRLQDVASEEALAGVAEEANQSLTTLLEQGYVYRAGWQRYVVTATGFERYARAHVEDYPRREAAIRNALVGVEQTTTDAVVARTGESRELVNHVLSLLQRARAISGFLTVSGNYCITRVSAGLKQGQGS